MKRVVVSMRIDELADRDERRDAVDQKLIRFILDAGFMPVLVSNSMVDVGGNDETGGLVRFLDEVGPMGVVLSGGNDVGSCEDRDLTERILLDYALKRGLPALGICRGMQMMGVYFGMSLVEVSGHVRTRHQLGGEINRNVNSYHNLGLSGCPDGFDVLAMAGDGVVEGIRSESLNWEGWMWHPEREHPFNQADIEQFKKLFS